MSPVPGAGRARAAAAACAGCWRTGRADDCGASKAAERQSLSLSLSLSLGTRTRGVLGLWTAFRDRANARDPSWKPRKRRRLTHSQNPNGTFSPIERAGRELGEEGRRALRLRVKRGSGRGYVWFRSRMCVCSRSGHARLRRVRPAEGELKFGIPLDTVRAQWRRGVPGARVADDGKIRALETEKTAVDSRPGTTSRGGRASCRPAQ